jgi:glutathione peroxidase
MKLTDFNINDINGNPLDWSKFEGKKLLLVNTASECGYTFHYGTLEGLHQTYKDKNFAIIGFPCNDFGGQEPGTEKEIVSFCQKKYGVTFQLTEKIKILGENAHPIYKWLKESTNSEVAWNFQKYLIDENGKVDKMIQHSTLPNDEEIINWIEN